MNNLTISLWVIAAALVAMLVAYGIDREMTFEVYQKYAESQDFERTITDCKFQSNCDYYNQLLWRE